MRSASLEEIQEKTERLQAPCQRPDQEPASKYMKASGKMCGHNPTGYISGNIDANMNSTWSVSDTFAEIYGFQGAHAAMAPDGASPLLTI